MKIRHRSVDRDGLAAKIRAAVQIAPLTGDHAQQIQGMGIERIASTERAAKLLGLVKIAGLK